MYVSGKEWIPSVLIHSLLWLLHIICLYFISITWKSVFSLRLHPDECVLFLARSEEGDLQGLWALRTQERWCF